MSQSCYTAALGIKTQQQRVDAIADNIANINTTAYKYTRVDFKDALYSAMENPAEPDGTGNLQRGHGVLLAGMNRVFSQGAYLETGRETDLYIDGEGFFAVQSPAGDIFYTRDGSFEKSVETDGTYLVTAKGYYVLDANGQKIRLQGDQMNVSSSGGISQGGEGAPYATLGIYTFPNEKGLTAVSDGFFEASDASGGAEPAGQETRIKQKALEGSNVEIAAEFSKLIRAQRVFSLSSRALTTADEMDGMANSLR
jgi:flagellar basal-body rod protein FlgG